MNLLIFITFLLTAPNSTNQSDMTHNSISAITIDWSDVISVFIGAFLGFVLGLFSTYISKKIGVKELKKKIKIELEGNRKSLFDVKDNYSVLIQTYSPVWDVVSSSDMLIQIDSNSYVKIIRAYAALQELNEQERKIDISTENGKKMIVELRNNTIKIIDNNMI